MTRSGARRDDAVFEDLLLLKGDPTSPFDVRTEPLSPEEVSRIRALYPAIPNDYLNYLGTVGWGHLAGDSFTVYGGPLEPEEIYGREIPHLGTVLLIGDDLAGYCVGIRLDDGSAVELAPNGDVFDQWTSFEQFIRGRIARLMEWWPERE